MRLITVFSAAVLLAAPIASAQTPGNPVTPRVPRVDERLMYGGSGQESLTRLTRDMTEREREAAGQPSARVTLIERIAPLVAEGRCNEARQMARQEGDRAVSRRIGEVCVEGRPTPIPEPS